MKNILSSPQNLKKIIGILTLVSLLVGIIFTAVKTYYTIKPARTTTENTSNSTNESLSYTVTITREVVVQKPGETQKKGK